MKCNQSYKKRDNNRRKKRKKTQFENKYNNIKFNIVKETHENWTSDRCPENKCLNIRVAGVLPYNATKCQKPNLI